MTHEMPTVSSSLYGTASAFNVYDAAGVADIQGAVFDSRERRVPESVFLAAAKVASALQQNQQQKEPESMSSQRRLVRVIMIDPHADVPMESAVLYDGDEIFTDKDNNELFFEIPIITILKDHNEKRVTWRDKSVKDRVQMLEPARIRDLKMVVCEIAKF